ncbi:hypothetical protein L1987_29512 [Smallanthus sonchifolius]|uniref:Uncharacterized protein n=1 Tax=Smallanthus sonchifolius TaxID=185202 RepID=A0ACB9I0T3_9ASTR|nr:hypothetical protein L1987_29512 [Smallanthus sonchifolius]
MINSSMDSSSPSSVRGKSKAHKILNQKKLMPEHRRAHGFIVFTSAGNVLSKNQRRKEVENFLDLEPERPVTTAKKSKKDDEHSQGSSTTGKKKMI